MVERRRRKEKMPFLAGGVAGGVLNGAWKSNVWLVAATTVKARRRKR
jgi:hypothetical protein